MSDEHPIRHADPKEGFDAAEPQARSVVGFGIGSVILLIVTILALQSYFDKIWSEAVYDKILAPPSEKLLDLRSREDWNLTHYGYFDKPTGQVRIPVDKAMELFAQEAASGKLFYPAKAYVPKKEEPVAAPAPAAPDDGSAPNPAGAPKAAAPAAAPAAVNPGKPEAPKK